MGLMGMSAVSKSGLHCCVDPRVQAPFKVRQRAATVQRLDDSDEEAAGGLDIDLRDAANVFESRHAGPLQVQL
jgi:hypothetical protein